MEPTTAAAQSTTPANRTKAPAKPRPAKAPTKTVQRAAATRAAHAAEKPAPDSLEFRGTKALSHMTHRENCVMVTAGGNKVGWTANAAHGGKAFKFSNFDDKNEKGLGGWEHELTAEMISFGIATKGTAVKVLTSLKEKGLLEIDGQDDEAHPWWKVTDLGKEVAKQLNAKVWK